MKKKKKILFTLSVLAAGFVCFCIWMVSGIGSDAYYTQIDNTQLEEVSSQGGVFDLHGGLPYSYTLLAYNEKGKEKKITFGTARALKEDAFLCLTVMPVRNVLEWSEVSYDQLPEAVQEHYNAPRIITQAE